MMNNNATGCGGGVDGSDEAGGSVGATTSAVTMATASTSTAATSTAATGGHRRGHRRQESFYEMTGLYSEVCADDSSTDIPVDADSPPGTHLHTVSHSDTVIKCHSRQPSSGLVDRERQINHHDDDDDDLSRDCGLLLFRPSRMQKLARIKVSQTLPLLATQGGR